MSVRQIYDEGKPINQTGANAPFSGQIDVGRSLDNIKLKLAGTVFTPAHLTTVQVLAGTKTLFIGSGAHIKARSAYLGLAPNDAFLDLAFSDQTGESEHDRMEGAFDTTLLGANGVITIKGDIGGATAPVLSMDLRQSAPQVREGADLTVRQEFSKVLRAPFQAANGGKIVVDIPFGPQGMRIKRLFFFHTGNMTGIEILENGARIHKSVKAANEDEQKRFGRVPQANLYVVDFCPDGDFTKAWDTRGLRSVNCQPEFSAADSGYVYFDCIDSLMNN